MMAKLHTVPIPGDLLESSGLLIPPDREMGLPGHRAPNRCLRLFVAAYMLGTAPERTALDAAHELYYWSNLDIAKPGQLSQADIQREVWGLVAGHNETEE